MAAVDEEVVGEVVPETATPAPLSSGLELVFHATTSQSYTFYRFLDRGDSKTISGAWVAEGCRSSRQHQLEPSSLSMQPPFAP